MGLFDFFKKAWGELPERKPEPPKKEKPPVSTSKFPTVDALAAAMGLTRREILWLGDPRRITSPKTPHYRLLIRRKKSGALRPVLAPRKKLKAAQRWILRNVLAGIPITEHCHGFVAGRSIRSNAAPHVNKDIVLQVDIKDFFHQFTMKSVTGFFRKFQYPLEVARILAALTTAPVRDMAPFLARQSGVAVDLVRAAFAHGPRKSLHPMLPQGAPTSPALSNMLCYRLDHRLNGLAQQFKAVYTRYADDMTFSGGEEFRRDLRRFVPLLKRILKEHRFKLAPKKFRFTRRGDRQKVTGLVVNDKVNVPRSEYKKLRAILHNCLKKGAAAQNRENHPSFKEHLRGRIAFVASIHPAHGAKLKGTFDRISW